MIQYVMYQKTQTTEIGDNLNFEDEKFDFLVKVEFILQNFPLSELHKKPELMI